MDKKRLPSTPTGRGQGLRRDGAGRNHERKSQQLDDELNLLAIMCNIVNDMYKSGVNVNRAACAAL